MILTYRSKDGSKSIKFQMYSLHCILPRVGENINIHGRNSGVTIRGTICNIIHHIEKDETTPGNVFNHDVEIIIKEGLYYILGDGDYSVDDENNQEDYYGNK